MTNCSWFWLDAPLQDPFRGGKDQLVEDVISVIHADDADAREKDALAPTPERLVYEWQIKLARQISPFWTGFASSDINILQSDWSFGSALVSSNSVLVFVLRWTVVFFVLLRLW